MNNEIMKVFDNLNVKEKNVLVVNHLKSLSTWDLKRVLCDVLDVDSYMDDEGLRKEFEKIINER